MKFAQEKMMIVEHFRKLQREGYHFNIIGDNHDNVVLYDSNLGGKFYIKPIPITSPVDLSTRTVYECRLEEVEYSVATLRQMADVWNDQLIANNNNRDRDIVCNIKSTQMLNPLHSIEDVEKEFFKYVNDLKVKMKVFQIKQIGADEDDY
jgi:hypothetical protein